jgi:hypothetical protein
MLSEVTMFDDTEKTEEVEEFEEILVEVKVLRSKGQASVVEWDDAGRTRRTVVPRNAVFEDEAKQPYVSEESLDKGIPYGADWETRLSKSFVITGAKVAEQLEVSGIWTKEDYDKNPSIVQQAVLGAARDILTELYAVAHSIPK